MKHLPIYRYMTPSPCVVRREQPLSVARVLMSSYGIGHIPVIDDGTLVGIMSERDLRLAEALSRPGATPLVEDAMIAEPYFVAADASLADVVAEMAVSRLGAAVVMDRGSVVGMLSALDGVHELSLAYEQS